MQYGAPATHPQSLDESTVLRVRDFQSRGSRNPPIRKWKWKACGTRADAVTRRETRKLCMTKVETNDKCLAKVQTVLWPGGTSSEECILSMRASYPKASSFATADVTIQAFRTSLDSHTLTIIRIRNHKVGFRDANREMKPMEIGEWGDSLCDMRRVGRYCGDELGDEAVHQGLSTGSAE